MERSTRTAMLLGTPARREIRPFEGQQHLMNRGRGQLEEPLDIGLCRWSAIDQRVDVYEREILSLPADSDEAARVNRALSAHRSDLMAPIILI